ERVGDPAVAGVGGHPQHALGLGLPERVVEPGDRPGAVTERRMRGDVLDPLTTQVHLTVVAQRLQVLRAGHRTDIVLGGRSHRGSFAHVTTIPLHRPTGRRCQPIGHPDGPANGRIQFSRTACASWHEGAKVVSMSTLEQGASVTGTRPGACPVAHDFDPFDGTPQSFFTRARRETPVFWHDDIRAYVLTRYEDCRRLLGDRSGDVSANAALLFHLNVEPMPEAMRILQESDFDIAPSVVDEDGEAHRLHRGAAQTPFTLNRVRHLREFTREQVTTRLDAIITDGAADIVDAMIYEVPATVILHMMGVPVDEMGDLKRFRGPWGIFIWGNPDEQVQ